MSASDTHKLRLAHWPKLSTFPTTAGVIVAAIILDFLTFAAWCVLTALLMRGATDAAAIVAAGAVAADILPDGWLLFLAGLHGVATGQFWVKRHTWDPSKAPTVSNGGAAG